MTKNRFLFLLAGLPALLSLSNAHTQMADVNYEWQLKRDKNGVQVFTSKVPGSKYKAVRAVATLSGKASSAIALVLDSKACPEWAELCKLSERVKVISPREFYIYTYNDLPFPVKDRDAVTHVIWSQDSQTGRISMTSTVTDGYREPVKKAIRLEQAVAQWHFTQTDNGTVLVESFAHIDPNGATPAWLTNMLLVDSPYKTIMNMREIVESGRYDDTPVDFLPWTNSCETETC